MQSGSRLLQRLRDLATGIWHRDSSSAAAAREIHHDIRRLLGCPAMQSVVFRQRAVLRLREFSDRLADLAEGRLVFESTETWRTVYEDVLESCRTRRYLSVALIRSDDYWRDAAGEASLEFNRDLLQHGFYVHRVFIIDEFFWPPTARTPSTRLFHWIQNQRQWGVEVSLLRLSDLESEPALVGDFGIYGNDAVGYQQSDYEGRTIRYEISFGPAAVAEAEEKWRHLLLFAKSFEDVVVVN